MDILNMTINDIIECIMSFVKDNKEIISFLFGGCGLIIFGKIIHGIKIQRTKISEMVGKVRKKGYYNYSDIVKKLRIDETIKNDFPEYSDYLFLQYGSSVNANEGEPNDYDFIVLLLGHPKDNVKHVHNSGNYPIDDDSNEGTNVDIVYRDYLSFLFAACAGMPYENSVITNSKLLNGHRGYYQWLENITKNILFDRDFLLRRFEDKVISERETYHNEVKYHKDNKYDIVRAGYYYITSMVQKNLIGTKTKVLMQDDIVPLSKVMDIGNIFFKDENIRKQFIKIVKWLKRIEANDEEIDISYIDNVINYIIEGNKPK